jgi:hypothetical protein
MATSNSTVRVGLLADNYSKAGEGFDQGSQTADYSNPEEQLVVVVVNPGPGQRQYRRTSSRPIIAVGLPTIRRNYGYFGGGVGNQMNVSRETRPPTTTQAIRTGKMSATPFDPSPLGCPPTLRQVSSSNCTA